MYKLEVRILQLLAEKFGDRENWPTQEELADQSGVSQTTVGRWMRGQVQRFDEDTIVKWCTFFECEPGDLFYLKKVS